MTAVSAGGDDIGAVWAVAVHEATARGALGRHQGVVIRIAVLANTQSAPVHVVHLEPPQHPARANPLLLLRGTSESAGLCRERQSRRASLRSRKQAEE
jgi:hypothetical protein